MDRRAFLKRLGFSTAAAAATAIAARTGNWSIDYEKALWLPGQKAIVDLAGPRLIENVTDAQFNTVMQAHGKIGLPRYTIAFRYHGDEGYVHFDDQWRALDGSGRMGRLTPAYLDRLTRDMQTPGADVNWITGAITEHRIAKDR